MTTLKFGGGLLFYRYIEYPLVFTLGGIAYMLIEMLWRGFTHWSMGLCSGLCMLGIYVFEKHFSYISPILKYTLGALFITYNEFITGCIVNVWLGWNVWDYSKTPLNIGGQICLLYSFFWFLLCIPAFYVAKRLNLLFIKKEVEIQKG